MSSLSLLVNIYGSSQLFVSEYRNMLADRLLQLCSYDTTREVRIITKYGSTLYIGMDKVLQHRGHTFEKFT